MQGSFGKGVRAAIAAAIAATVLSLPASASADTISIGSVGPTGLEGGCGGCTAFQRLTVNASPSYKVPPGTWTITSWSTRGDHRVAGTAKLRVFRPTCVEGQWQLVAESNLETVPADAAPTFTTSIPVQPGDLLGIRVTGGDPGGGVPLFYNGLPGDTMAAVIGDPNPPDLVGNGGMWDVFDSDDGRRTNVQATLDGSPTPSPPPLMCGPGPDPSPAATTSAGTPSTSGADAIPPQTRIGKTNIDRDSGKAKFNFSASEAGSSFRCKLDRKPFRSCRSPKTYRGLDSGKHVFKVKALDPAKNADTTPAKKKFTI